MALTDVRIRQAKPGEKPYRLSDAHGLYLQIQPSGSRYWRYNYRIGGKQSTYAIGTYPAMSIAEARRAHMTARDAVMAGTHPIKEKRRQRAAARTTAERSFQRMAEAWFEAKVAAANWSWRYTQQVGDGLRNDVYPAIGALPISEVTSADVLEALQAIERRGAPAVAILLRQIISAVFVHGIRLGVCTSDPAAALKGVIMRPAVEHAQALGRAGAGVLVGRCKAYGGNLTTKCGLLLLAYTFVRTVEMRNAEWSEFDLDAGIWLIPGRKMKMRRDHMVPLSRQAVEVVRSLTPLTGAGRYLFPNTRRPDDVMSATTINRALEHMGYKSAQVTGHDFRATAATMLYEAGYRSELVEMQLAHAEVSRTKRAYNHAKYLDERRAMLQWFADELDASAAQQAALAKTSDQ